MGKLLDFVMTGGDWQAMQEIQVMKSKARLFDNIGEVAKEIEGNLDEEEE
jgi:hypothetical protein